MKKISVLAIITLLLMVIEFTTAVIDTWDRTSPRSLVENRTMIMEKGKSPEGFSGRGFAQALNVVPENSHVALDSVHNTRFDSQVPYVPQQIVVCGWTPSWTILFVFSALLLFPLIIWGLISFIKLLISVFKQEVFTRKNAHRLRVFVYASYGSIGLFSLIEWLTYQLVAKQTEMPGYIIKGYEFTMSWSDIFLMFLIAEIFALGVKLQEEQELTI